MPSDRSFNRTGDSLFLAYLFAFFAARTIHVLLIYPHVRALGVKTIRSGRRRDGTLFPHRCVYYSFRCILIVFVDCYSNRKISPALVLNRVCSLAGTQPIVRG
jgi:hypothetical protein